MAEKCFCHLGEYEVKDAKARAEIEFLKNNSGGSSLCLHQLEFSIEVNGNYVSFKCAILTNFKTPITKENFVDLCSNYYDGFNYGEVCIIHHDMQDILQVGKYTQNESFQLYYFAGPYPGSTTRQIGIRYTITKHSMNSTSTPITTGARYMINLNRDGSIEASVADIVSSGMENANVSEFEVTDIVKHL